MMNPFLDAYPKELEVSGKLYRIRTDYRAVLKVMHRVNEAEEPFARLLAVLWLYKEMPDDLEAAVRTATDFIAGDQPKRDAGSAERKQTFSYEKDAPFIASDFLRFYRIDLASCRYLHWWKFQMLLEGLPDDSGTKTRIGYRSINTGKIKDREERERIRRIQRRISLEDVEADEYRIGELFGGLM